MLGQMKQGMQQMADGVENMVDQTQGMVQTMMPYKPEDIDTKINNLHNVVMTSKVTKYSMGLAKQVYKINQGMPPNPENGNKIEKNLNKLNQFKIQEEKIKHGCRDCINSLCFKKEEILEWRNSRAAKDDFGQLGKYEDEMKYESKFAYKNPCRLCICSIITGCAVRCCTGCCSGFRMNLVANKQDQHIAQAYTNVNCCGWICCKCCCYDIKDEGGKFQIKGCVYTLGKCLKCCCPLFACARMCNQEKVKIDIMGGQPIEAVRQREIKNACVCCVPCPIKTKWEIPFTEETTDQAKLEYINALMMFDKIY